MIKMILNKAKKGIFSCGTHVDATWHSGPRGSATRAHAAPTRRCDTLFIFTYILVIVHIVFRLSEENY